jgi:hypothetical protein
MNNYAVVYRHKDTQRLIRESGFTFDQAQKRSLGVNGDIHKMNGAKSFIVKRFYN